MTRDRGPSTQHDPDTPDQVEPAHLYTLLPERLAETEPPYDIDAGLARLMSWAASQPPAADADQAVDRPVAVGRLRRAADVELIDNPRHQAGHVAQERSSDDMTVRASAALLKDSDGPTDLSGLAQAFKALGDPVRLRLMQLIASDPGGEVCVRDLMPRFELTGPTISHHLRVLRESGLVTAERRRTWVYYKVVPDMARRLSSVLNIRLGQFTPEKWSAHDDAIRQSR